MFTTILRSRGFSSIVAPSPNPILPLTLILPLPTPLTLTPPTLKQTNNLEYRYFYPHHSTTVLDITTPIPTLPFSDPFNNITIYRVYSNKVVLTDFESKTKKNIFEDEHKEVNGMNRFLTEPLYNEITEHNSEK